MNATTGRSAGDVRYFNNLMVLLIDCLDVDSAGKLRCITARMAGVACGCVLPLIILLGLVGNGLVGYVNLVKIRPLTRQNMYFGCIAVVDAITMTLFGLVNFFLCRGLPWLSGGRFGYILQNDGYLGCKVYMAVISVCPLLSAALLLVMVADRVLSVVAPFRFRTLGPKVALKWLSAAAVASIVLSIPAVVMGNRNISDYPNGSTVIFCFFDGTNNLTLLYWSLICNPPTLVLAITLFINFGLLACVVRLVRERKLNLGSQVDVSGDRGSGQHLNAAALVLVLSSLSLAAQIPTAALYWALTITPKTPNYTDENSRIMVNILSILGPLSLYCQACSFPVMMRRSPKFRACVLELVTLSLQSTTSDVQLQCRA